MPDTTHTSQHDYTGLDEPIFELLKKQDKYQRRITELEQQVVGFEAENRLLYRLANAQTLDLVLNDIYTYMQQRWSVGALGIKFVDYDSNQLVSGHLYGLAKLQATAAKTFTARIPLYSNLSIAAQVATSKSSVYITQSSANQFERMSELDKALIEQFQIHELLVVPVISGDKTFAVAHLFALNQTMGFSEDDIAEIQSFLFNVSTHIKREYKWQRYDRYKGERQAILNLSHEIASANDLEGLLAVLGDHILAYGEFDGYLINLYQGDSEVLVCERIALPGEFQAVESTYLKMKIPTQVGDVNVEVFRTGEPRFYDRNTIALQNDTTRTRFNRWKLNSLAVVPIIDNNGAAIGTVMLFRQEGLILNAVVYDILDKLVLFASQLKRAQSLSLLQSKAQDIEMAVARINRLMVILNRISRLISPDEICRVILEEIMSFFGLDLGVLFLKKESHLVAEHIHISDTKFKPSSQKFINWVKQTPYPIQYEAGSLASALLNNAHFYFSDIKSIFALPMSDLDREGSDLLPAACSLIIMPVRIGNEPIGVMWLYNLEKHSRYSDEEINLIAQISTFAGAAISNAELYEKVESQKKLIEGLNNELEIHNKQLAELARKDRLTGLFNFGYFQEELSRRINECSRSAGSKLSLVLIDIDRFKVFNDTYGHVAGNVALVKIATVLRKYARRMDIVCRYGGEEFAVILPRCDLDGAIQFSERLREAVAISLIEIENNDQPITVTISIGCGTHLAGEGLGDFVVRVDEALYRAKENGRNRVELAAAKISEEFREKSDKTAALKGERS